MAKKYLFTLLCCFIFDSATAENLKLVGLLDPTEMKIYVDKDSVVRRAHMSQINLVLILASAGKHSDEKISFDFDCAEKIYQLPDGQRNSINVSFKWENSGRNFSISGDTINNIYKIACKKSYEFWK